MKILVTGGNGFIGSRVVEQLIRSGHQPHLLLRETSNTDRIRHLKYTFSLGDITDRQSVVNAGKGCTATIHLACLSSWADIASPRLRLIAIGGTRNVTEAAVQNNMARVVLISSVAAIAASKSPVFHDEVQNADIPPTSLIYAGAKREAEKVMMETVKNSSTDAVVCYLSEVYGPNDTGMVTASNLVDALTNRPAIAVNGGVCILHVEDAAAGILASLAKGKANSRYILSGEPLSIKEMYTLALDVAGIKRRVYTAPAWLAKLITRAAKKMHMSIGVEPAALDYAVYWWWTISDKAEKELQWTPKHTARETFRDTIRWLAEQEKMPKPLCSSILERLSEIPEESEWSEE